MNRSSGILLPISSLPSEYGIGTFGKAAYDFADFLKAAGQKYWQVLPMGPTSYGDSPYQSISTFAGNPYFIDLEELIDDKLLSKKEVKAENWGTNPRYVDYGQLYESRNKMLTLAKERGWDRYQGEIQNFLNENRGWLEDYALYMACKKHFDMKSWIDWPDEDIRMHRDWAVEKYKNELREEYERQIFIQFLFFKQWTKLKAYINEQGVSVIGDIPIYVSLDSSDVWSEPHYFQLDDKNYPVAVSGVPPDYFSEDGQLWGNPLYDWGRMEQDGFGWWIRRIEGAKKLFDVIRIDHFRGFDTYWSVPYGEKTAKNGQWLQGPGMRLVGMLLNWFGDLEFIAEDLGEASPSVAQLLADSQLPGMRVLEFAFDGLCPGSYQPHQYEKNCVCYTGTHDNAPIMEWAGDADKKVIKYTCDYLNIADPKDLNWGMIKGGMSSIANLFVAQMQDYLGLGKYNRTNTPGKAEGNWQWRMVKGEADKKLAKKIYENTKMYSRLP